MTELLTIIVDENIDTFHLTLVLEKAFNNAFKKLHRPPPVVEARNSRSGEWWHIQRTDNLSGNVKIAHIGHDGAEVERIVRSNAVSTYILANTRLLPIILE